MNLIEIKEKVRATRIPAAIYYELLALEVDTVGPDSPQAKILLADQMQRAEKVGGIVKVPLDKDTQTYLLYNAVPNLIDVAKDNENRRLVNSLQKFQALLHAKLVGVN